MVGKGNLERLWSTRPGRTFLTGTLELRLFFLLLLLLLVLLLALFLLLGPLALNCKASSMQAPVQPKLRPTLQVVSEAVRTEAWWLRCSHSHEQVWQPSDGYTSLLNIECSGLLCARS